MRANSGTAAVLGCLIVALALPGFGQSAGWRAVTAEDLRHKDYLGAALYLQEEYGRMEAADKPEACALLAFVNDRLGDSAKAREWIAEYFETHGNPNLAFHYLGMVDEVELEAFINSWRTRFPHLSAVTIVWPKRNPGPLPPRYLQLGLDLTNDALYRLSDSGGILGGGMLHKGFNILDLEAGNLFERSGSRVYVLDLKAGDISLRTEVSLAVSLTGEAEPPAEEKLAKTKGLIYELSFYVGSRLVAVSQKTENASEPLKLKVKPVNLRANPMFKPPGREEPFDPDQMGVSIPDAIGIIGGLIKDLVTKKPKTYESSIDKATLVQFTIFRQGSAGAEVEVKASFSVKSRRLPSGR